METFIPNYKIYQDKFCKHEWHKPYTNEESMKCYLCDKEKECDEIINYKLNS